MKWMLALLSAVIAFTLSTPTLAQKRSLTEEKCTYEARFTPPQENMALACKEKGWWHPKASQFNLIFYVVCYGTNYSTSGQSYDPVAKSGEIHTKDGATKEALIRYIIDKWARNKPTDTWGCRSFNDVASQYSFFGSLQKQGHRIWIEGDDRFYLGDLPKALGY